MTKRRICKSAVLAALVGLGMLATSPASRADLALTLYETGGVPVVVDVPANTGPAIFSGTIGPGGAGGTDFSIFLSVATSNSPGGATAMGNLATITIMNLTAGALDLHIDMSAQGFTSPQSPPPLNVFDTLSGTLVSGSVTASLQGFADATNTLFGTGFASTPLSQTVSGTAKSLKQDGVVNGFSPGGATYSLTIKSDYLLSGGGVLTLTGGNVQVQAVPEPMTLASGVMGLGLFGGAGWLRRRRKAD